MIELVPVAAGSSGGDETERTLRLTKRHLAAALRILTAYGFTGGTTLSVSARDPSAPDRLWINPTRLSAARVRVADLVWVDRGVLDLTGPGLERPWLPLHTALYAADPEIAAVACVPSAAAAAWAMQGRPVPPVTVAVCELYERHQIGLPPTAAEPGPGYSREVAKRFAGQKALLVPYFGIVTTGRTVGEAVSRALTLDRAADVALRAKAAGELKPLPFDVARLMRSDLERLDPDHEFGPLYDETIDYEPTVLVEGRADEDGDVAEDAEAGDR